MTNWIRLVLSCLLILLFIGTIGYAYVVYNSSQPVVVSKHTTAEPTGSPKNEGTALELPLIDFTNEFGKDIDPTPSLNAVANAGSSATQNNQSDDQDASPTPTLTEEPEVTPTPIEVSPTPKVDPSPTNTPKPTTKFEIKVTPLLDSQGPLALLCRPNGPLPAIDVCL